MEIETLRTGGPAERFIRTEVSEFERTYLGLPRWNPSSSAEDTETQDQSLGPEAPLEEEMAAHTRIPAWRTPWTEEPGRLYSPWGRKKSQTRLRQLRTQSMNMQFATLPTLCNQQHLSEWPLLVTVTSEGTG